MIKSNGKFLAVLAAGVIAAIAGAAMAQQPSPETMKPRFVVLPATRTEGIPPPVAVPIWTFNWTYSGTPYSASVLGGAPSTASTTVPVFLIPIHIHVGGMNFTPTTLQSNGKSAIANTKASPIFQKSVDYVQNGVDLGKSQYNDAVQRASFYGITTNMHWHTVLGTPTVLPKQTIAVPAAHGSVQNCTPIGPATCGVVNINFFDGKLAAIIAKFPQITPGSIPIFVIYDTYLLDGPYPNGCCIGGYHTYNGTNVYAVFSYVGASGDFSQDVSALSHELGETVMDPFTNNNSPCGILEVADPLEGDANYGDYPYTVAGFTYHLQDLVLITYFGAPATTSLLSQWTFQGTTESVCSNGS